MVDNKSVCTKLIFQGVGVGDQTQSLPGGGARSAQKVS